MSRAQALWERSKPLHGAAFFLGGFAWDAATLTRVDKLADNAFIGLYLVVLAGLLVVERRAQRFPDRWPGLVQWPQVPRYGQQLVFGGLYSAYFIFYSMSAGALSGMVFLGVLVALALANEFGFERLSSRALKMGLFSLCATSWFVFLVPVLTGWLGPGVFWLAALLGAGLAGAVVAASEWDLDHAPRRAELWRQGGAIGGFVGALALLHLLHLIPPIPLAVRQGGIFHGVDRTATGYAVTWQPRARSWLTRDDRVFHLQPGDKVWCVTAVFAPNGAAVDVVHEWQRWVDGAWETTDTIPLSIQGGRGDGFRSYSRKANLHGSDTWRVRVLGPGGREVARYPVWLVREEPGERRLKTRALE